MRLIRTSGSALVIALLMSAVAIRSDAATGVEYGRCLEVGGTGAFREAGCTAPAQPGSFEWYPGFGGAKPILKARFTFAAPNKPYGLAASLGLVKPRSREERNSIECEEASATGNLSGAHSWKEVKLSLRGCKKLFQEGEHTFSYKCHTTYPSEAAREAGHEPAEGEIDLDTLKGEAGMIHRTRTSSEERVGIALAPESQPYFAETDCGNVRGSEIFSVVPNAMQLSTPLSDLPRADKVERLPKSKLEMEDRHGRFKPARLYLQGTVTFEEPVELRDCKPRC
jgi:hypothetical protein